MLWWWLSERLFGSVAFWHYLLNALAQGAVTLALWRWMVLASGFPRLAFAAAVVFAVHPVAIGTTLWLSDRFDLLAALFGLLGLQAAWRFAGTGNGRDWARTLVWIGLALLSKEIALVMLAAVFAAWLFADVGLAVRRRMAALVSLVLLAAIYLFVRWLVIVDAGASYLFAQMPFFELVWTGLAHGARAGIDYLGHGPRLTGWKAILAVAGAAMLVPALALGAIGPWNRARWRLLVVGAVLALSPLLLQVPLLALQDIGLPASGSDILLAFHARHFYVCCIGLLAIAVALLSAPATPRDGADRLAAAGAALLVVVWFSAS